MRKSWNQLVYIDLYSGPGYSQIKETNKLIKSSPLISLSIPNPFDIYIFSDNNPDYLHDLEERVQQNFSDKKSFFVEGDCNTNIEKIKGIIPQHSKSNRVLTFCFADPFDLNLKYETIKYLTSNKLVDLLILQAYYMDANRNFQNYINENNQKISEYLDDESWRVEYLKRGLMQDDFVTFLAEKYEDNMKSIGYFPPHRDRIEIPAKNVPLYYLEFYSKHEKGREFYKKVQYYADDQYNLEFSDGSN